MLITLRNSEAPVKAAGADAAEAALTGSGAWPAVSAGLATIWVLDDTRREWLREYGEEVSARHITRTDIPAAKAGNLKHGWRALVGLWGAFAIPMRAAEPIMERKHAPTG